MSLGVSKKRYITDLDVCKTMVIKLLRKSIDLIFEKIENPLGP